MQKPVGDESEATVDAAHAIWTWWCAVWGVLPVDMSAHGSSRWALCSLAAAGGALVSDVLAVARAIDVDPERVHREAVEDRGREGGVAEVLAPLAERDIGRDRPLTISLLW